MGAGWPQGYWAEPPGPPTQAEVVAPLRRSRSAVGVVVRVRPQKGSAAVQVLSKNPAAVAVAVPHSAKAVVGVAWIPVGEAGALCRPAVRVLPCQEASFGPTHWERRASFRALRTRPDRNRPDHSFLGESPASRQLVALSKYGSSSAFRWCLGADRRVPIAER